MDELEALERDTRRYYETEAAHDQSRQAVTDSVLRALRARKQPTEVAGKSPFTEVYVRQLARKHGIPDYMLRRFPSARGELERRLPDWPQVAAAIAALDIGLEDAEFVGGVLWYALTRRGSEGNPDEQKRVITERLVRWATRDGGDGTQAAAAIRPVLDEFLPDGSPPARP